MLWEQKQLIPVLSFQLFPSQNHRNDHETSNFFLERFTQKPLREPKSAKNLHTYLLMIHRDLRFKLHGMTFVGKIGRFTPTPRGRGRGGSWYKRPPCAAEARGGPASSLSATVGPCCVAQGPMAPTWVPWADKTGRRAPSLSLKVLMAAAAARGTQMEEGPTRRVGLHLPFLGVCSEAGGRSTS